MYTYTHLNTIKLFFNGMVYITVATNLTLKVLAELPQSMCQFISLIIFFV